MEANRQIKKASEFIRKHDRFVVIAHVNPDGDAAGSALSMAHLLRYLNKSFVVISDGAYPQRFNFITGYELVVDISRQAIKETYAHAIILDTADRSRLGEAERFIPSGGQVLSIDHHPTNTLFADMNVICPAAASTTEILFDLIDTYFKEVLDQDSATALYTGLVTDTGGFRYSNTTRKSFVMAADLLSYDVEPALVAEKTMETMSMGHFELLKRTLPNIHFAFNRQVAMISVTQKDMRLAGAEKDDMDGLVSYARMIEGVAVAVVFKEVSAKEIKVSLRSKQKINVSEVALTFGGGGHAKAAGYTFTGTLQDARQKLLHCLEQNTPLVQEEHPSAGNTSSVSIKSEKRDSK